MLFSQYHGKKTSAKESFSHAGILLLTGQTRNYFQTRRVLTHFMPLISFDAPWKHKKTSGFLGVSKEISGMKWVKSIWRKDETNLNIKTCAIEPRNESIYEYQGTDTKRAIRKCSLK